MRSSRRSASSMLSIMLPVGGLEFNAKIDARIALADGESQRTQAHFINMHNGAAVVLKHIDICLSCRLDFIARQHGIDDERYF